jgi:RecA-family ATPase
LRQGDYNSSEIAFDPAPPLSPLPSLLHYTDLARDPIPPREWLVRDRIPMRNVCLLSGEGAIGKSLLAMQLSGAIVLGKDWIGTLPEQGPALYMSCEEDEDEICRRMQTVAECFGSSRQEMIDCGLHFLSYAGRDAVLGQPDHRGIIRPTPLFEALRRDALRLQPKLIVIDTAADTFAGDERNRAQTRQYITLLRGMAIEANSAVTLCAHPSLEGIKSDTGLSGSTGWHNSVRARLFFKKAADEDPDLRALEVKKNNYGPVTETILLRYREGIFVPEPGVGSLQRLAAEQEVDQLFMTLLHRFLAQGRGVSDKPSSAYAPAIFAKEPEAKARRITKEALTEAMSRLFAAQKIRVVTVGPTSRSHRRIEPT